MASPLRNSVERGRARRLIEIAVQGDRVETMLDQRTMQQRDFALAIAEDDGVFEVVGGGQDVAQCFALLMRLAAAS